MSHSDFSCANMRLLLGTVCFALSLMLAIGAANAGFETTTAVEQGGQTQQTADNSGSTISSSSTPSVQAMQTDGTVLEGSAENVPLSVALRQILPPNYGFMVAENVDASMPVSWKGGAAWREVLHTSMKSAGLIAIERDNHFEIRRVVIATLPANNVNENAGAASNGGGDATSANRQTTWSARKGDTLRSVLREWTKIAGIGLQWDSGFDFPLMTDVKVEGTFEDAARTLISGFDKAKPQPFGKLYRNSDVGDSILVMEARGNNYGG